MALTDTFVRQVEPVKNTGDKYADGGGLYLLVKAAGKYWRMDYRYLGRRKTLALGVYPAVSLSKARKRRDAARELLADGVDPGQAKRDDQRAKADAAAQTFGMVARQWLTKTASQREASTQEKITTWLEKDVFPSLGNQPISTIGPRDVLATVQKMEARGAIDSAHRVKQICGQVFRYAVATGFAERDVTVDLKGVGTENALRRDHRAEASRRPDARDLRVYRTPVRRRGPQAIAAGVRAPEWAEMDLDAAEWRIPGSKMKMGVDHLVPLSTQVVAILRSLVPLTGHGKYVFPSIRTAEHEREHHQRRIARPRLQQRDHDRAWIPGHGAHHHG
jgi:integrase